MSIFSAQQIADNAVSRFCERYPVIVADYSDLCGYSVYDMLWERYSCTPCEGDSDPLPVDAEDEELIAFAAWVDGQ